MRILVLLLLLSNFSFAQSYKELNKLRDSKIEEINQKKAELEEIEKKIIVDILSNGHEITVINCYPNNRTRVWSNKGAHIKIAALKEGEKLTVIGREGVFYKVFVNGKVGYADISNINSAEYPLSLMKRYNYYETFKDEKHKVAIRPSSKPKNITSYEYKPYSR